MRLSCWKSPGCIRLIEKFSYPLVLWTSTVLNFAVPNLTKILSLGISYVLIGLVTRARFPSQMELIREQIKWQQNSRVKKNI